MLLDRCRVAGGILQRLLDLDLARILEQSPYATMTLEHEFVSGRPLYKSPAFSLHSLPLPASLSSPEIIEEATLEAILGHPKAVKLTADLAQECLKASVTKLVEALRERAYFGPYDLLIPWNDSLGNPCQEADELVASVEGLEQVVPCSHLTGNRVVLIQMTPDVIQLIVLEDRLVPQVREDFQGNVGFIVAEHAS